MYVLVLHFFKLQALKIELSRPGGVEEDSAEDSSKVEIPLQDRGPGGLSLVLGGQAQHQQAQEM